MNQISVPTEEQIKWILSNGIDGKLYRKKYLPFFPIGKKSEDYFFEQIFTVSERDVYEFVLKNGWDKRVVSYMDKLPNPLDTEKMFYDYIILPRENDQFKLAHFGSYDRRLWNFWNFSSEEEMWWFITKELYESQKTFWKHRTSFLD